MQNVVQINIRYLLITWVVIHFQVSRKIIIQLSMNLIHQSEMDSYLVDGSQIAISLRNISLI